MSFNKLLEFITYPAKLLFKSKGGTAERSLEDRFDDSVSVKDFGAVVFTGGGGVSGATAYAHARFLWG